MDAAGGPLRPPVSAPGGVAALSLVTSVAGAALSGSPAVSALLVAAGLILGVRPVVAHRRDPVIKVAASAGVGWVVYGAIVGSLPAWSDLGAVGQWATTEGRILVSLATMMIAAAVTGGPALRWLLLASCVVVTAVHAVALVLFAANWSPPGFPIEWRGLFFGLSSSHHVVAFLSVGVTLIALGTGRLMSTWLRWSVGAIAIVSILAAGSRTALLGLLAGAAVIAWFRCERRRLWRVTAVGLVVLTAGIATNDRFRTTALSLVDPDFIAAAAESFTTADPTVAISHAESEAEANILLRLTYWGAAVDHIVDSPIVGIGAFRQNDLDMTFSGPRGLVHVATGGEATFNDSEPHNVILYLLLEVGIVGLMLFAAPYVIAWRRTSLRRGPAGDAVDVPITTSPLPGGAPGGAVAAGVDRTTCAVLTRSTIVAAAAMSMVSSGVLATGLGIIANAVIFAAAAVAVAADQGAAAPVPAVSIATEHVPLGLGYRVFRRTLDVVVSLVALVVTLPLLVVVAVLVKTTSRGPALYTQRRVGRDGTLFDVLKFRTMRDGAHAEVLADPVVHAAYVANGYKLAGDDPRITPIGRWLRKCSFDELPQLVNVLVGDMSVVGVRPLVPDEFFERTATDRSLYCRMRPGMTGSWQIEGRSALAHVDRLALDRAYLERPSAARDLTILLRTPAALLRTAEAT